MMQLFASIGGISAGTAAKFAALVVLTLFLPLSALTYQRFRSHRKRAKIQRILVLLKVREEHQTTNLEHGTGQYLCIAVAYATVAAILGLTILLFGRQFGLDLADRTDPGQFPLTPGVFHTLAIRMMLAGALAVVIYNSYEALAGETVPGGGNVWPALAFVLGMFPQRGINWIRERVPFLSQDEDPSVRNAPLEMIEGITFHDRVRLEEESIYNCYDLATADFVPSSLTPPTAPGS